MDTKTILHEADQTFTEFLQVLQSIPNDKINTVPFEGSWTAAQDAQHIVLSAGSFVQLLNGPVIDTVRDPEQNVETLRSLFLNFHNKFKSPDFIVPEEKHYDKDELIQTITQIKADYLKAIPALNSTQTCLAFELPGMGHITRAEAINFTNVHTIRHLHQLKNIREKLGLDA